MTGRAAHSAGFADHFSRDSASYAEFRPRYPAALFEWVARLAPARRLVWDVATGSGQAATMLARQFDRVIASDASTAQLKTRSRARGVYYLAEQGEACAMRDRCADLVTVAQAYHWFDHPRFHAEVDRVLVTGGAFAAWCYGAPGLGPEIDEALSRFYDGTVGAYWPRERNHVERGYRHFRIPIEEIEAPPLRIEADLSLAQLLGYVRTWSAVGRYMKANGHDPVPAFGEELAAVWGDPMTPRRVTWPISVRAGRWLGSGSRAA
ncbi:MAG TPA: class I SAM-dependent methyltransferase [Gemmatimonadales bacterium]|nr:class I SAM-dependent methyltransferase [Gemmatimonadales bacterium]